MSRYHFYQVTLKVEEGPSKGEHWLYKARVKADTDEQARRLIVNWVAEQAEPPPPPVPLSEAELDHIKKHWDSLRVLSIEPGEPEDLEAKWGIDLHSLIYWWDHVVLPAQE
jgi:hypothetical protein